MVSKPVFLRADFPMLSSQLRRIYLDSAATALKPQSVIDALTTYYAQECGTVHRAIYDLAAAATEKYNAVRSQIASLLNASSDEIIFTKGTTESINLVASSFGNAFLESGDAVLITAMEHHANIVPWQLICRQRGARLEVAPMNEHGELDMEAFGRLLSPRVKLVSIVHVSNAIGTVNPISRIIEMAHRHGAKVFVDGAQSVSHFSIDVQKLDVDFFAFSGHKVYGPTGVGILYGKKELLEALPPYQGGGDMIEKVTFEETTFQRPPLKFEAGTPPIGAVMGLGAALSYIEGHGLETIATYEQGLLKYATTKLQSIPGLKIIGNAKHKGPILTFTMDGIHALDLGTFLNLNDISVRTGHLCAQPCLAHFGVKSAVRLSLAPYNTISEIDEFERALLRIADKFSTSGCCC